MQISISAMEVDLVLSISSKENGDYVLSVQSLCNKKKDENCELVFQSLKDAMISAAKIINNKSSSKNEPVVEGDKKMSCKRCGYAIVDKTGYCSKSCFDLDNAEADYDDPANLSERINELQHALNEVIVKAEEQFSKGTECAKFNKEFIDTLKKALPSKHQAFPWQ